MFQCSWISNLQRFSFTMRLSLIEVIRLRSNLSEGYTDYSRLPIEISCNPINLTVSSLGVDSLALNHYVIFWPLIPLSAPVTASRFWDTDVPYSSFMSGARITDNLPWHWVRAQSFMLAFLVLLKVINEWIQTSSKATNQGLEKNLSVLERRISLR